MSDLDEIKQRRMEELQRQMQQQQQTPDYQQMQQQQAQMEQMEQQKRAALKKILTPEARQRLANLRLAKPQMVEQFEMEIIQLAQMGRLKLPINDDTLKQILLQSEKGKREINITRK
ncbi:MAG: DNA-binding protein [Methanobacteriaceae archaeon]|nr:DNA-binding protein [Methanobacteriaceae archaeon]